MPGLGISIAVGFNKGIVGSSEAGSVTYHATLPDSFTTSINVGSALNVESIIVSYSAIRGTDQQYGEIVLLSPYTDIVITPPIHLWDFDDVGLSCTAQIIGTNIVLNLIVDNSSANSVKFDYMLDKIIVLTKTHS